MASYNKCIIVGNLGKDAQMRQVGDKVVLTFSVAVTRNIKKDGVESKDTTWFAVDYWVRSSAMLQYLKKGTPVIVEGSVSLDKFTGRDGGEVTSLKLSASAVQLLGGGSRESNETARTAPPAYEMKAGPVSAATALADQEEFAIEGNDLPF